MAVNLLLFSVTAQINNGKWVFIQSTDYSYSQYNMEYFDTNSEVCYSLESAYENPLHVKMLDLSNQQISSLDYRIASLINLEVLVLKNNDLTRIIHHKYR